MSRKRKRKRSRARKPAPARARANGPPGALAPGKADQGTSGSTAGEGGPARGAPRAKQEGQRPRGLFRGAAQSPFPPFGVSLARGLGAVGSSPLILAVTFVSTIATWAVFVALGTGPTLRTLVIQMSVSPLHVFFDVDALFQAAGGSVFTLVATIILATVRAVSFGLLLLLIVGALRGERPDVRGTLRLLPRVGLTLFAVYVGEVVLVLTASQLIVGILGPSFSILVPLVALHFLVMVPVVAALEHVAAREALRKGLRAARLPGARHIGLVVGYFLFTLYATSGAPALSPATPTVLGWAFVLAVSFVHVGVLAAFAFRWLAVREEAAINAPVPTRQSRRQASS
ncbi:MAG: hypothetical protein ACRDI0_03360 [Actinomycetota bacterium]